MDQQTKNLILKFQKNEITEHLVYKSLARLVRNKHNSDIMRKISDDELRHYNIWKQYTNQDVKPRYFHYWFYTFISMVFGVTFGIKLMENGESKAQVSYSSLTDIPQSPQIQSEEEDHEKELINMIDEEKLRYMGSVVLGLNDALVEFTGALAGFTFALQNSRLIGMVGFIMGISASLSMAASEYLSTKTDDDSDKNPRKSALYTGLAYILTVTVLITPYFLLTNFFLALSSMIALAILLILLFTFYSSVTKEIPFKKRFLEMLSISMGVAALSFLIGLAVKKFLNINI